MSLLDALFKRSKRNKKDGRGIEEHLAYLESLSLPAIALTPSTGESRSWIGGLPLLPANIPWPEWQGAPLAFLCQLDLGEIPGDCDRGGLPPSGVLYFFYHQEQETWGFDPKDKGSWQVIYLAELSPDAAERSAPQGLDAGYVYTKKYITFSPVRTYPDWQDDRVNARLTDEQSDRYIQLCSEAFGGGPEHHLLGYPSPVQGNDMDLECQLVSNGLYCGDSSGYRDPRARQLAAGRSDWLLLLQLDSDDDTGMMWGDCGMLYFWIKRSDLQAARFEDCWMILQCS